MILKKNYRLSILLNVDEFLHKTLSIFSYNSQSIFMYITKA